jgi:hypothetical protein
MYTTATEGLNRKIHSDAARAGGIPTKIPHSPRGSMGQSRRTQKVHVQQERPPIAYRYTPHKVGQNPQREDQEVRRLSTQHDQKAAEAPTTKNE